MIVIDDFQVGDTQFSIYAEVTLRRRPIDHQHCPIRGQGRDVTGMIPDEMDYCLVDGHENEEVAQLWFEDYQNRFQPEDVLYAKWC